MAGKLLARQIKKESEDRTIIKIREQDGSITVDDLQINGVFKSYYTELYTSTSQSEPEECKSFLDNILIPVLTQVDRQSLEKDVSSEELLSAMAILQKGKSLSLDGLPIEFYSQFSNDLLPLFLAMINACFRRGCLLQSSIIYTSDIYNPSLKER